MHLGTPHSVDENFVINTPWWSDLAFSYVCVRDLFLRTTYESKKIRCVICFHLLLYSPRACMQWLLIYIACVSIGIGKKLFVTKPSYIRIARVLARNMR